MKTIILLAASWLFTFVLTAFLVWGLIVLIQPAMNIESAFSWIFYCGVSSATLMAIFLVKRKVFASKTNATKHKG